MKDITMFESKWLDRSAKYRVAFEDVKAVEGDLSQAAKALDVLDRFEEDIKEKCPLEGQFWRGVVEAHLYSCTALKFCYEMIASAHESSALFKEGNEEAAMHRLAMAAKATDQLIQLLEKVIEASNSADLIVSSLEKDASESELEPSRLSLSSAVVAEAKEHAGAYLKERELSEFKGHQGVFDHANFVHKCAAAALKHERLVRTTGKAFAAVASQLYSIEADSILPLSACVSEELSRLPAKSIKRAQDAIWETLKVPSSIEIAEEAPRGFGGAAVSICSKVMTALGLRVAAMDKGDHGHSL